MKNVVLAFKKKVSLDSTQNYIGIQVSGHLWNKEITSMEIYNDRSKRYPGIAEEVLEVVENGRRSRPEIFPHPHSTNLLEYEYKHCELKGLSGLNKPASIDLIFYSTPVTVVDTIITPHGEKFLCVKGDQTEAIKQGQTFTDVHFLEGFIEDELLSYKQINS